MLSEQALSSVLSDFARTVITDFPIQGILDDLVERIVEVLPISGAGVTLITADGLPHHVAASDGTALSFERLQTDLGEGPCRMAYESGEPVAVPDLRTETRFPRFVPAAMAEGMQAVFTFPLRHGEANLGALDLYRDRPGPLDALESAAAQTLADVASAYLLNAQSRAQALEVSDRSRLDALHDGLTGLPNRALLQQRLEHAGQRAQRSHAPAAVLFVDLDRFKRVNDTYGHQVGDALLVAVGRRLASLIRPGDTLARVSGDEFVVLCEDLAHVEEAEVLARRVAAAFAHRFVVGGVDVMMSASVGIAYAGPGQAVDLTVVADADRAMYEAKRRGGGRHQVLDPSLAATARTAEQLERELQAALGGPELDLAYQPVVGLADGRVHGVEALLRWSHPLRGPVPALTAVGLAEQGGVMSELGTWVLERACADHGAWAQDVPGKALDLFVNVSAHQLTAPGFAATVARVLDETRMDPGELVLEVTEGVLLEDVEQTGEVLDALKALGLRLALDDFGTGYCSLSYLQRLPVDVLKVDRGFVADLGPGTTGSAIVEAVLGLAGVLRLAVVAEGVETEPQRAELLRLGADLAQGHLFSRPLARGAVAALLAAPPAPRREVELDPGPSVLVDLDAHRVTARAARVKQ